MKIFNRSYLPDSIKYNGKQYMYDAAATAQFEKHPHLLPFKNCIQVNVLSPRVKGVKDFHGNEYKPQVYIFSQVSTEPAKQNEHRDKNLASLGAKQNDPVDHGKTFIPAKQIILRERDGSSIDFDKQPIIGTYTNYYAANQRVRQLIGEYSDVCYDITFADGYRLTGSIDLEPRSFWEGNGSGNEPLSWHLKTFWTNVSKVTLPYPDMTQEDIDEAKTLIEKYQLSAAQETVPDFTSREDFYLHDATPAMNERTKNRLIEIAQLGMTEIGVAAFGIEGVMSGLYIEMVWRYDEKDWKSYIDWVKDLLKVKAVATDWTTIVILFPLKA